MSFELIHGGADQAPLTRVLDLLRARGLSIQDRDDHFYAQCPAHEDDSPSLSVGVGADGKVLLKCHAGCTLDEILLSLDLVPPDLFPPKAEPPQRARRREGAGEPRPPRAKSPDRMKETAKYDYVDEGENFLYQVVRKEGLNAEGEIKKVFLQRQRDPSARTGWRYKMDGVRRVPYRLPAVLRAIREGRTIYVGEGEKVVERLVAAGLAATCNSGGAKKWTSAHAECLRGARVVVLPDNDQVGREHAQLVAQTLHGIATEVRVVELPGLVEEKDDVVEWLAAGHTIAELEALAASTPVWSPKALEPRARPEIDVTVDEHLVVDQVVDALGAEPGIFQRNGRLVRLTFDHGPLRGITRPASAPTIGTVPLARLRELVVANAELRKTVRTPDGGFEKQRCHPPDWLVREVDARDHWEGIRVLEGVTEAPLLRADGTVLSETGFDAATGIYYEPVGVVAPVPSHPTLDDARRALGVVLEAVVDFPFAGPVYRASWLAGLLTPLARQAFAGPAPMFLVDANVRGSGKSKLCDLVAVIITGKTMPKMPNPDTDEEMRKRITSLAMSGDQFVMIDNVAGTLGHASLDAALTGQTWRDRVLGRSEMTGELRLLATWYASGNNVALGGDLQRRVAHIRLESDLENPEVREDFRHPDLLAWAAAERPRLLAAALTILRAYHAAGAPKARLRPWGSFEGWSNLVRQAVVWVGEADPGDAREALEDQADTEKQALAALLEGWSEVDGYDNRGFGITIARALRLLEMHPNAFETLRNALETLVPASGKGLDQRRLGKRFQHLEKRVIAGKRLERVGFSHGSAVWMVRQVAPGIAGEGGSGGNGGSVSALKKENPEDQYLPGTGQNTPPTPVTPPGPQQLEVEL